ncbi:MAG: methylenetetrahydrofolate reductase C-terminal domain-containing protein [Thermoguttaceae bacterium]
MSASNASIGFRDMLRSGRFCYGAEVVTTRGPLTDDRPQDVVSLARGLLVDPRIGWISITDNPGGGPMLPPDWLAGKFAGRGANVVVHLTCKDLNRAGLETAAWRYASEGFLNILALTGDFPKIGFRGLPNPVFDIDSAGLIALLRAMNEGLEVPSRSGKKETLPKTDFFIGAAVSPFKRHERELMPQYYKLLRKIRAGARWVIPQLGYDMRKFHEIKLLLASRGMVDVPVIGNVYLLTRGVANLFNSGKLAGCVVSDGLLEQCEKYAAGPDKGQSFFREMAAKQLAVFRGLGFAAGYLGGIAKLETFGRIIELAESYALDDWREFIKEIQFSQPDEFFLFQHDPETGLGSPNHFNPQFIASLARPPKSKEVSLSYRLSRFVHRLAFTPGQGLHGLMQRLFRRWDKKPGISGRVVYALERSSKHALYGCQDCGDCSLPECAYLCPRYSCSKCGRNGPCGGSSDGRCELDDKECIWARIYERLKSYGESQTMLDGPLAFYDSQLDRTSSWANFYLRRDHSAGNGDSKEKKLG